MNCKLHNSTQLFEQGASIERIGQYVNQWKRWTISGSEYIARFSLKPVLLIIFIQGQNQYKAMPSQCKIEKL